MHIAVTAFISFYTYVVSAENLYADAMAKTA